jgi:hypothetical protein
MLQRAHFAWCAFPKRHRANCGVIAVIRKVLIFGRHNEGEDIAASRSMPFEGGDDDEDIPITPPLSHTPFDDEGVATKKSNEMRIGPITRARAKLLEQQVNSLLIEPDLLFSDNFILPKSMHLCMIRFVDNMSVA